jgi:hypothetical protein
LDFLSFVAGLRQRICGNPQVEASTRARYAEHNDHYQAVASELHEAVGDRNLTVAGYFHGISAADEALFQEEGTLSAEVFSILSQWRSLRSLTDHHDPKLARHLAIAVLPLLSDWRGALLLVVEQIRHADVDGSMREFSRTFHTKPLKRAPLLRGETANHTDVKSQAKFLQVVCAGTAKFLGLWALRNLAEDLALRLDNPDRLVYVLREVARLDIQLAVAGHTRVIREAVEHLMPSWPAHLKSPSAAPLVQSVRWEWHHVASVARKLKGQLSAEDLHRFGRVTVVCSDREACFEIMGKLHGHFRPIQGSLEEYQDQRGSGYKALHVDLIDEVFRRISIRIISNEIDESRFALLKPVHWGPVGKQRRKGAKEIVVYSPKGWPVTLKLGSIVLHFAAKIHKTLVARAKCATINGVPHQSVLRRLKGGDVVYIETSEQPVLLPKEWTEYVPKPLQRTIRTALKEGHAPRLRQMGREILTRTIAREVGAELVDTLDAATLDAFADAAGQALIKSSKGGGYMTGRWPRVSGSDFWLRQLALCEIVDPTGVLVADPGFQRLRERFLTILVEQFRRSPGVSMDQMILPTSFPGQFDDLEICRSCQPEIGHRICGKIRNRCLELHKRDAACAVDCEDISWCKTVRHGVYVVIEALDRIALARDVFTAVAKLGIDVIEFIGSPWWGTGVIRLYLRYLSRNQFAALRAELNQPDILRILGPDDDPIPVLEAEFPPRRTVPPHVFLSYAPFGTGAPVDDEKQFYGRAAEHQQLLSILSEVMEKGNDRGSAVKILGPLRFGKSSLLLRFKREVREKYLEKVGFIRADFTGCCNWNEFRRRLYDQAEKASDQRLKFTDSSLIRDFVVRCRNHFSTVVIGVDETMNLLDSAISQGELEEVLTFFEFAATEPGVMLVLTLLARPWRKLTQQHHSQLSQPIRHRLSKFHEIVLSPLSREEVRSLLRAEKHRPPLGIQASNQVCDYVYQLTGGNPYWASMIASKLYRTQARGKAYTIGKVNETLDDLRTHCLRGSEIHFTPLELKVLAALVGSGSSKGRPMGLASVADVLDCEKQEIEDTLEMLAAGGFIQGERPSSTRWKVPPFLAGYLRESKLLPNQRDRAVSV